MKSNLKIIITLLICILLVGQFTPKLSYPTLAAKNAPVELKIKSETDYLTVDDIFQLQIKQLDEELQTTDISFPENITIDENHIDQHTSAGIHFNTKNNTLTIDWDLHEKDAIITLDIIVKDIGETQFYASSLVKDGSTPIKSNQIDITVVSDNDEKEEDMKSPEQEPEIEDNNESDKNINTDEKKSKDTLEDSKDSADDPKEHSTSDDESEKQETDEINKEQDIDMNMEKHKSKTKNNTMNTVQVNNWNDFLQALESSEIENIEISSNFSASGATTKEYKIGRDKVIAGNQHTINFHKHRLDIQHFNVAVENLNMEAEQSKTGNSNASIFYSNSSDSQLHLKNSSFNGIQQGQVANMRKGHIIISGKATFQTKSHFEVFEARQITFEYHSEFIGITTGTGPTNPKEVINLYNSPVMTVGKNASVHLETNNRKSILNVEDNSTASIHIHENAALTVYAANTTTNSSEALIDLSGKGSSISIRQDATLDISNHREGSGLGGLLNVNGTLSMHDTISKVVFWDKGANSDHEYGNRYRYFPRIINGALSLNQADNATIASGNANDGSALSISDNERKSGRTFAETFTNRNTSEIKRLLITSGETLQKPIMDPFTDTDTILTGSAIPGIDIEIRDDQNNKTWTTIADPITGEFSVPLEEYAPYKAGTELHVKAMDAYGYESDNVPVNVQGAVLTFDVPNEISFRPTMIVSETITIPRQDKDWSINVLDTRDKGEKWNVTAKTEAPLSTPDGHTLSDDALIFVKDGNEFSLKENVPIHEAGQENERETTIKWKEDEGILIKLNPEASEVLTNTEYSTNIEWTLTDAP